MYVKEGMQPTKDLNVLGKGKRSVISKSLVVACKCKFHSCFLLPHWSLQCPTKVRLHRYGETELRNARYSWWNSVFKYDHNHRYYTYGLKQLIAAHIYCKLSTHLHRWCMSWQMVKCTFVTWQPFGQHALLALNCTLPLFVVLTIMVELFGSTV